VRLALRALLVAAVAAVATQSGAAAPTRMRLVNSPAWFVLWNRHDGLLGTTRCDVAHDVHEGLCVSGAVERTSDGGRTYHVVLRTRSPVDDLRKVGPAGAIATTVKDQTWRTLDGGRTWRRVPSQPVVYWLTAQMGVSFRSYFVHNQGRLALRVTHDGGRTWQRQPDPCEKSTAFSAAADLVTPKLWWVVCLGEPGAGNEDKAIYSTHDAGRTWRGGAATLLIGRPGTHEHGGIQEYGYPEAVTFAPGGWGLLTESRGTLYVTRDGGMRFHAEPKVARPEVDFAGGSAVFRGGIGYVLLADGPQPRLIETHDYGRTWSVVRRWRS
jgi:photosystem II stability/assembly factor-like uncharacterized protein